MYKFLGYVIKTPDGEFQPQVFKSKEQAMPIIQQNGLTEKALTQIFRFESLPYTESKEDEAS
jgi:hypothetical protein